MNEKFKELYNIVYNILIIFDIHIKPDTSRIPVYINRFLLFGILDVSNLQFGKDNL